MESEFDRPDKSAKTQKVTPRTSTRLGESNSGFRLPSGDHNYSVHDPYAGFGDNEASEAELAGHKAVRDALAGIPHSTRETTIFSLTQLVHDPYEGFGGNCPNASELEGRDAARQVADEAHYYPDQGSQD